MGAALRERLNLRRRVSSLHIATLRDDDLLPVICPTCQVHFGEGETWTPLHGVVLRNFVAARPAARRKRRSGSEHTAKRRYGLLTDPGSTAPSRPVEARVAGDCRRLLS